ncbi:hypothetical protein SAMN05192558_10290 [Actinokineospora alba]|uniref:Nucleotidyltransferase domain-containing protein n=1 Tax=Actinokineospora alba TaxID=504798 RepID=A0A1H0HFB1_9PSEU|nr:hypothetical protein [Actinokineospora alba]TDP64911.1 hypothetical protein C8E96_0389 [Actinokineospora alba]SDH49184.1 hypothetical protein SAMN05421871_101213 [Actinokineospora alba]SDO17734.1 hypothetical protein SAMN05192558_10290 [Actinokineospora alba]
MVLTGTRAPDAGAALARVGLTVAEVRDLGGSVLDAGRPFLVGSLAAGMGNRGSDVDIHLLVPGLDQPTPPFLLFAGATPIDIEHYPAELPGKVVRRIDGAPTADVPLGRVSLAPPPDRSLRRRLARWLTAVPLLDDTDRVFAEADAAAILPVLVRAALDEFVQFQAAAAVADRVDAEAAAYLWARAGRQLLELRCRAAGDVTTGHKWLPDRATRLGITVDRQRAHYTARCAADITELAADTGLARLDPLTLTRVAPDPRCTEITIGRQRLRVTPHQRVLRTAVEADGLLGDAVDAAGAAEVLGGVLRGELVLRADSELMGRVLADAR